LATALYSLDTSSFVRAWWVNYPPDLFKPVWDHLDRLIEKGIVKASKEVLVELEKQDDDLFKWCKDREEACFVDLIEDLQDAVIALEKKYPKLVATGRNKADPFVMGLAVISKPKLIIITEEGAQSGSANKPNIPYICRQEGLVSEALVKLLRDTGFRFK
jgi:hypothetical protein